ncbi:MAG: hypothetical protein U5K37_12950 [Natrialbaceae archaeon]|nr:hypothetical protein [Natrialbaceae archaeon]
MAWLETTYYYVRGQSRPDRYDFPGLRGRVRDVLDTLVDRGFATVDDDLTIEPTRMGILTSRY